MGGRDANGWIQTGCLISVTQSFKLAGVVASPLVGPRALIWRPLLQRIPRLLPMAVGLLTVVKVEPGARLIGITTQKI
jgi:hypothetical protein